MIKPLQSITLKNDNGDDIKYDVLTRAEVSGILAAIGATTESTTSGNPLTLTSVESLKTVKEKGATEQESTTGTNLISPSYSPAQAGSTSHAEVDSESQNSITASTTSSYAYAFFRVYYTLPAGTYTFNIGSATSSNTSYVPICTIYNGNTVVVNSASAENTPRTFTLSAETTLNFRFFVTGATAMENTVTFNNVQLNSGSTALTYEPYTGGAPAPSPSYPQGIYGLEGYSDAECTTLETDPYADRYYKVDVTVDGVTRTVRTEEKIAPLYDGDYLDFVSGAVHREKAKITIPANDTWSWHNTSVFAYHDITGAILTDLSTQGTKEVDCDIAKGVAWTQRAQSYWTASLQYGLSSVALKSPSVTTYAQFQAATANLPITLVYQLNTPTDTTTELTEDLSALYGSITLNGNGTMDVTYRHG